MFGAIPSAVPVVILVTAVVAAVGTVRLRTLVVTTLAMFGMEVVLTRLRAFVRTG